MIIPIKQILTENEFVDQATNSLNNYNNIMNAYKGYQGTNLDTMERQALLKGMNTLTGSNYITHDNLDPNNMSDRLIMNAGKIGYQDRELIKDYAALEKDKLFKDEVQKHLEDNTKYSLENQSLHNQLAGTTLGTTALGLGGAYLLHDKLKNRNQK